MTNFLDQMAAFDLKRGKTPINPGIIEGAGTPELSPRLEPQQAPDPPPASELYGAPLDHEVESPLSRLGRGEPVDPDVWEPVTAASARRAAEAQHRDMQPIQSRQPVIPEPPRPDPGPPPPLPDLIVLGANASVSGHAAILSDQEQASVREVVIRAIERTMKEERAMIRDLLPRRGRRPKATTIREALTYSEDAPPDYVPRRKRGRPKKEKP